MSPDRPILLYKHGTTALNLLMTQSGRHRVTHCVHKFDLCCGGSVMVCVQEYVMLVGRLLRCHYTKSNPIDDHSNISSKRLQKQNFKPLGHYTCMQCGTSHLQKVQENILSRIILATYRKFTVATVRFTQNVTGNIFTHPIYQQVANVTV